MPKSTAMITDMQSVITNGPQAITQANSSAAAGPIMDYIGVSNLMLLTMKECSNALKLVKTDTDAGDGNLTLINGLLAVLNGTGSPSTQAITDAKTLVGTAPSAPSATLASAPGGPIMDLKGMFNKIMLNLEELVSSLTYLHTNTDNGTDGTNRTLLANLLLVLV
jgi:hypothetical protein